MMLDTHNITTTLVTQLPFLAVYIVVLVMAAVRSKNHPAVSNLLIIAMSLFILVDVANIGMALLPLLWRGRALQVSLGWAIGIGSLVGGVISAGGWILLIAAMFAGRQNPTAAEAAPKES